MEPGETTKTRDRAPGLDGVRALAVLTVIGFHEGASGLPGGFLGVDIFFVLSGFLITDLLVARYDRTGRLDLAGFWTRRARRLLPALAVMLVVVTAAAAVIEPGQEASLRPGAAGRGHVHEQLVPDPAPRLVLRRGRAGRGAAAARSPVVAGHRGAVLPDLAADRMVRDRPAGHAPRARGVRADRGGGFGAGHDDSVHAGRRPVRGLLRHRHSRLGPADRGRAGAGPAAAGAHGHPGRAFQAARRGRHRRARRPGLGRGALLRQRPGRLPGGPAAGRVRRGGSGRRRGGPRGHRRDHQLAAAALGRRPVLRDLPVALAGDRVRHRAGGAGSQLSLAVAGRDGGHDRAGVGVVALHRDTHYAERAGCHRPALDTARGRS